MNANASNVPILASTALATLICVAACASAESMDRPGPFRLAGWILDESDGSALGVSFTWEPALGASGYLLEVRQAPDAREALASCRVEENTCTLERLPAGQTLYWSVTAFSSDGRYREHEGPAGTIRLIPSAEEVRADVPRGTAEIDGRIGEGEWDRAARLKLGFYAAGQPRLDFRDPRGRLMWDDEALYLLVETDTPGSREVAAEKLPPDSAIWTADAIEIFLLPEDGELRQLILNPMNSRFDARAGKVSWAGAWRSATRIEGPQAVYELAIPWEDLGGRPATGENWKFNLVADYDAQSLMATWSWVKGGLLKPERFGTITFDE